MRAGVMKDRVTIQSNTPTASAYGENAESWSSLETVYADVKQLSASETLHAGAPIGSRTYRIRYRHHDTTSAIPILFVSGSNWEYVAGGNVDYIATSSVSMTPAYRLLYRTRALEVIGVHNVGERHRFTEIVAREVT